MTCNKLQQTYDFSPHPSCNTSSCKCKRLIVYEVSAGFVLYKRSTRHMVKPDKQTNRLCCASNNNYGVFRNHSCGTQSANEPPAQIILPPVYTLLLRVGGSIITTARVCTGEGVIITVDVWVDESHSYIYPIITILEWVGESQSYVYIPIQPYLNGWVGQYSTFYNKGNSTYPHKIELNKSLIHSSASLTHQYGVPLHCKWESSIYILFIWVWWDWCNHLFCISSSVPDLIFWCWTDHPTTLFSIGKG